MRTRKLTPLLAIAPLLLLFFFTTNGQTTALLEPFDSTTAGFLPAGWASIPLTGNGVNWSVSTTSPNSPPHAVFGNEPPIVSSTALVTPNLQVVSQAATLRFKNNYNLEGATAIDFDGMVLEIRIGGGSWTDILAAGGTFISGGYTHTISTQEVSPIGGRRAWSGNSGWAWVPGSLLGLTLITTLIVFWYRPVTAAGKDPIGLSRS